MLVGGIRIAFVLCALLLAIPAGAQAHHLAPGGNLSEAQLRAEETLVLGPEHAAEHAYLRAQAAKARRDQRLSPADQRRIAAQDQREADAFAISSESAGPPGQVGRWTHAPFQIPHPAVSAAMLPTGEVLFWGMSFPNEPRNRGNAALWDPSKGYASDAFTEVPPPRIDPDGPGPQVRDTAPIFCSGLSMLASGEVFVTGGNLVWPDQYDRRPVYGLRGTQLRLHLQPLDSEVEATASDGFRPLVPGAGRARRRPDGNSRRIHGGCARRHLRPRSRALHARLRRSAGSARWPSSHPPSA